MTGVYKQQLEETKHVLTQTKQQHILQLEQIEAEESAAQVVRGGTASKGEIVGHAKFETEG